MHIVPGAQTYCDSHFLAKARGKHSNIEQREKKLNFRKENRKLDKRTGITRAQEQT